MSETVLRTESVVIRFGGVVAVNDLSIAIEKAKSSP